MRELQGRWPGLDWGRWEVGGGSSVTAQAPNGRLRELGCAGWQENRQQGTPAELVGASWRGRWVSGGGRRQAGSGMARSRARARLNWVSQGQRCGRCRVRRRAERVRRPAKAKTRRLRVLVVTICSPSADAGCPAGQVVGHRLYRQPGAVGGEAAGRHVVQSDTVLEVAYRILDLGVAAMISLQFEHLPIAVGDEAVIAVGGEEGQLGTGRGLHPPDDEPYRRGVRLTLERGC